MIRYKLSACGGSKGQKIPEKTSETVSLFSPIFGTRMGAAASVVTPTFELMSPRLWADPEVRIFWQSTEEKLDLICLKEREFLIAQRSCMFRKHEEIIRILTCKTKKQLKRLVNGKVPGSSLTRDEVESLGGGPYASFIGAISASETECRVNELNKAIGGVGCNEELLVIALAGCSSSELRSVETYKGKKLIDIVKGKTKQDSIVQKFLLSVLQRERDGEDVPVDIDAAAAQAQEIHANGAARTFGVVEDVILGILCKASRAQCQAIDTEYLKLHNMTLIASLSSKFSGATRLGLAMWTLNRFDATAYLLNYLVSGLSCDSNIVARVLARYEKSDLKKIDLSCKELYKKSVYELLGRALTGNFAKAALGWLNADTVDSGNEEAITSFIDEQMVWKGDKDLQSFLFEMAGTQIVCDKLKTHLAAEEHGLVLYLDRYLHDDYILAQSLQQTQSNKPRASSKQHKSGADDMAPPPSKRGTILLTGKSRRGGLAQIPSTSDSAELAEAAEEGHNVQEDFHTSLNLVSAYLSTRFDEYDPAGIGSVKSEDFWIFFDNLGLQELGFTSEESENMKSWVEWEHDGVIVFEEAREELAESIVDSIHGIGKNVQVVVNQLLISIPAQTLAGDRLPPDLLGYLTTTFNAYDVDKNGLLDYNEFWKMINAMNLGITAADFEQIFEIWDGNKDGSIAWAEAIKQFDKILYEMIADGADHWIGLVDSDSSALFWYNVSDKSSQWMNDEDQANFRANAVSADAEDASAVTKPLVPLNPLGIKRRSVLTKAR